MNKTISVNISGFAFHIEEQAHETLSRYLKTIRGYFTSADGVDEIMADIEARISEIFQERLDGKRDVVDMSDVNYAISILGQPEAFIDEEEAAHANSEPTYTRSKKRRIFRDPDNSTVAGVAAGIAAYFGWDPIWIRLAFVLLTIGGFSGVPIYIILWIIMPEAKTASEKLEMRGEEVNVENIGKKVAESFDNVKETVKGMTGKKGAERSGQQFRNGVESVATFLARIVSLLFLAIAKIIGLAFIVFGVFMLFVIAFVLVGDVGSMSFSDNGFHVQKFSDLTQLFLTSGTSESLFTIGLVLTLAIPVFALLYGGIKMLFGIKHNFKIPGIVLTVLWFIGIGIMVTIGLKTAKDFGQEQSFSETIRLDEMHSDTLILNAQEDNYFSNHIKNYYQRQSFSNLRTENDIIYSGMVELDVVENYNDSIVVIEIVRSARGETHKDANVRSENIQYQLAVADGQVNFDQICSYPLADKFRGQKVDIIVKVPQGKSVHLNKNMRNIIYDIKNVTNTYDGDMVGLTWTMTPEGLTCVGCNINDEVYRKGKVEIIIEESEAGEMERQEVIVY